MTTAALAASLLAVLTPGASGRPLSGRPSSALHHVLLRAGKAAPLGRSNTVDSLNWAGYVVPAPAGHAVTSVSGRWVVPTAQLTPPGMSAAWAGIGGYSTGDLLQAGTTSDSAVFGSPQYYAWFELLPDSETLISGCSGDPSCTVNPGDSVAVSLTSLAGSHWHLAMSDDGHWSWEATVTYQSSGSSADWILEAPTLVVGPTPLANVGAMIFDGGNGFSLDGHPKTMNQDDHVAIRLSFGGVLPTATPSAIDGDGDGFRACSYGAACPALHS